MDRDQIKVRALVVDDNKDAAVTFSYMLELYGHEARCVTDSRIVLDVALQWRPHITFLDLGMPHLNGYEVARLLRHHFRAEDMCLVAVTGYNTENFHAESRRSGFDAHVPKPLEPKMAEHIIEVCRQQLVAFQK